MECGSKNGEKQVTEEKEKEIQYKGDSGSWINNKKK